MPIPIPQLNDRDFTSLMEEVRALVPRYNARWTNFNTSDPGVTLLELFAWLCEQVLYRVNRIPLENFAAFLKLLGVTQLEGESLEDAIRRAQQLVNERYRAVTVADYEFLALERMNELEEGLGGRAIILNNIDLEFAPDPIENLAEITKPGHVTVIVLPRCEGTSGTYCDQSAAPLPVPTPALLAQVDALMTERRLLTTRTHAVAPFYLAVQLEAFVVLEANAGADVRANIETATRAFYNPLDGGPDGTGWPIGRDVYRSEFFQILEGTEGVDYVDRIRLAVTGGEGRDANIAVEPWQLVNVETVTIKFVDASEKL
ncbi:MAG: hypothetical protein RIF32_06765 [Leptospirales bacterium]|jgi:hypothetical protein